MFNQKKFVVAVVLFACAGVVQAGPMMRDGKWEITTTMEMPGMPFAGQPTTHTVCYTKKDTEDAKKTAPDAGRDNSCKKEDFKVSGNKATWKMRCEGKHPSVSTGEMIYHGDHYEGTIKVSTNNSRHGEMNMVQHIKGQRLGDCK